jgi:hypothetical protein
VKPKTRSPIKDKPLRVPGQSISEQRTDLFENSIGQPLLLALIFVLVAGLEWWRVYSDTKPNPVLFSGAAALAIAYAAFRIYLAIPKLRALRLGMEGEQVVGQFLERLRADGFHVFHDVLGAGFNVDHVLIGPAGVFTIETKTWSKPTDRNARVSFDGDKITIGTMEPDRDPVTQAKGQAGWLRTMLSESTGRKVEARPVIVFPGWFIEHSAGSFKDVWVLEPKALPAFLANQPQRLTSEDVALLSFHLSRLIRSSAKEAGKAR